MTALLIKETCEECGGTGITFVQTTSLLGLIRKQVPTTCSSCGGKGYSLNQPKCSYCDGRGLLGNERDVCRPCNGTGYGDQFRWIPHSELQKGRIFHRICSFCRRKTPFEIVSPIDSKDEVVSWEEEESLRQRRKMERVRVECTECHDSYWIEIDPEFHRELSELTPEERAILEENDLLATPASGAPPPVGAQPEPAQPHSSSPE